MWKQYMQTTKSAKAKLKEPENVRERIKSLSQALTGLKEEIKIENSMAAQNLERIEKQEIATMHSQVFALKKAFSDLADAMIEEVEGVRSEYRNELNEVREELIGRITEVERTQQASDENSSKVSMSLTVSIKQAFQHIQGVKNLQDDLKQDFEELKIKHSNFCLNQQEIGASMDKNFKENCEQVFKISKEFKDFSLKIRELEIMPKQLSYVIEKEKEKTKLIEDKVNKDLSDFDTRLKLCLKEFGSISNRQEFLDLKMFISNFEYKADESFNKFKNEVLEMNMVSEKKWEDFNRVQENFNQFVHREIKSIEGFSSLSNRIEFLEELSATQRRELFSSLASLEQNIYRKQEKIVKALYQLAGGRDIPEAVLMI